MPEPGTRTFAVIPAAGHSTRMGRPKLSLPVGGRTVIECTLAALRSGGVGHVLVVVGPHVPELVPLAAAAGADVCLLPQPTADMRSTAEHGLRWIEQMYRPRPDEWWILAPADHPVLEPSVIRQLIAVARSPHSIAVPVHSGRRGHPTAIAWRHVGGIRALAAGEGINAYLRAHGPETIEVAVDSDGIFADLDTPDDYERLLSLANRGECT
ncbi:MAG TPA: NTP transferase domain-containing protein [Gemmataceae bacterium]|nr:NTP transferase domain-containing protein [Gemmataceae bacterium]